MGGIKGVVNHRRYTLSGVGKNNKEITKPSLEFDDLKPGISVDEQRSGKSRVLQIIAGVLLVAVGIPMIPLFGPGWLMVMLGLNLIKPDNAAVKFLRKKIPGIPEEGAVPRRYLVLGGVLLVISTLVSIFYGDDLFDWFKGLVGWD